DLPDRVAEAADIVVRHIGPARDLDLLDVLGEQLDLGVLRDPHDTARLGRDDPEPDLLKPKGGLLEEHAEDVLGEEAAFHRRRGPAVDGRRDDVARDDRPAEERAARHGAGACETKVLLRRRELDAAGRLDVRPRDLDRVADPDVRVRTLEAVEPDDPEPLILPVRRDRDRTRAPLPDDLDHIAFPQTERLQRLLVDPRDAAPDVLRLGGGDLEPDASFLLRRSIAHRAFLLGCEIPSPGRRRRGGRRLTGGPRTRPRAADVPTPTAA